MVSTYYKDVRGKMNSELDWPRILADLDAYGCALVAGNVLSGEECAALAASYTADDLFRSRVVMARHGFGRGEYKYFRYPLPKLVADLREVLYAAPLHSIGFLMVMSTISRTVGSRLEIASGLAAPLPSVTSYPATFESVSIRLFGRCP